MTIMLVNNKTIQRCYGIKEKNCVSEWFNKCLDKKNISFNHLFFVPAKLLSICVNRNVYHFNGLPDCYFIYTRLLDDSEKKMMSVDLLIDTNNKIIVDKATLIYGSEQRMKRNSFFPDIITHKKCNDHVGIKNITPNNYDLIILISFHCFKNNINIDYLIDHIHRHYKSTEFQLCILLSNDHVKTIYKSNYSVSVIKLNKNDNNIADYFYISNDNANLYYIFVNI